MTDLDKKYLEFRERFGSEFIEAPVVNLEDVIKSCFLIAYRCGYGDGAADATRKVSSEEVN